MIKGLKKIGIIVCNFLIMLEGMDLV